MNLVSVGQSRPQIYWNPRFLCRISTETEWKAATDQVNSESEARKPTKKKKNSSKNKKRKRRGHKRTSDNTTKFFELIISGAWCLGRWRWVCGGFGSTLTLARSWARKRAKFHVRSALSRESAYGALCSPPLSQPPNPCYFILPYAIYLTPKPNQSAPLAAWPWGHMSSALPPPPRRRPWLCSSISATVPLCSIYWEISIDPSI